VTENELISRGLSQREASLRLEQEGYNELPSAHPRGLLRLFAEVLFEPMILLLLGASGIYFSLGDFSEAVLLSCSVLVIACITLYQSHKTESALKALQELSSPRALVLRDGSSLRVPGREVVRGDLLLLKEGDRVPADALLLQCSNLQVDESLLTGESVPVRKKAVAGAPPPPQAGGDDLPYVFSGSLVTRGQGLAEVTAIASQTQLGKIGKALESLPPQATLLQKEIRKWVVWVAALGLGLCALTTLLYGWMRGDWLQALLTGITMAMSMIPEEIPVVLTVFMALGAWRMSKKNVLAREASAIETLGATTALCVDKTGTLTQNKMTLEQLSAENQIFSISRFSGGELPETFHEVLEYGILASQKDPFDPMEKAVKETGQRFLANTEHIHENWKLVKEYPLSPELLALSHVWSSPEGSRFVIAAKGAPEAIADLCHLDPETWKGHQSLIRQMAQEGLRVLAVAKAFFSSETLPSIQHDFDFEWVGLIAYQDPIRPQVPQAIQECYAAGIQVLMITGDYPETAKSIARQIGMKNPENVMTGTEMEALSDEELKAKVESVQIYARMAPEQKLRLVQALQSNGEVVAMTGDGVNDAPALKAAHIGIAMGQRGTDVAREAAGLVLVDDDFSSIVQAVGMGRRIYANIRKALLYILSVHVPIAGLCFLPVVLQWPFLLMPAHIVFLELIIDPSSSIVFESEPQEEDAMRRPPRPKGARLLNARTASLALLKGLLVLLASLLAFQLSGGIKASEALVRSACFVTLIAGNLALLIHGLSAQFIWKDLKAYRNRSLWFVLGASLSCLLLAVYWAPLRGLFHFDPLSVTSFLQSFGLGLACLLPLEFMKKGKLP